MKKILIVMLGLFAVLLFVFFMSQGKEETITAEVDTGFTRFQTEELMREIGYVQ